MSDGLGWDDLEVALAGPGVEIRTVEAAGMTNALIRLSAGFDARPVFKGLPGDLCQVPHWGYVISGQLALWTADGSRRTYEPGGLRLGARPCSGCGRGHQFVELSPSDGYAGLMAHVRG